MERKRTPSKHQLVEHLNHIVKPLHIVLSTCIAIGGCAGAFVERNEPIVSQQSQDEAGKLPVGRVTSVQRVPIDKDVRFTAGESGAMMAGGAGLLGILVTESLRSNDWNYRYSVQMKDGSDRIVESQFLYKVGECLAFRSGLSAESVSAVRSRVGECD